jgi:hypothetical protein
MIMDTVVCGHIYILVPNTDIGVVFGRVGKWVVRVVWWGFEGVSSFCFQITEL